MQCDNHLPLALDLSLPGSSVGSGWDRVMPGQGRESGMARERGKRGKRGGGNITITALACLPQRFMHILAMHATLHDSSYTKPTDKSETKHIREPCQFPSRKATEEKMTGKKFTDVPNCQLLAPSKRTSQILSPG